jgi:hypothetical protein
VISTSTTIKAFALKFVELCHQLDQMLTEKKSKVEPNAKAEAKAMDEFVRACNILIIS